jgi:hypothetical protein
MNEKVFDIDLDVLGWSKKIDDNEEDSVFYVRGSGNGIFICYNGMTEKLVNSIISAMDNQKELYDILSASVILFEEEYMKETE